MSGGQSVIKNLFSLQKRLRNFLLFMVDKTANLLA